MAEIELTEWRAVVDQLKAALTTTKVTISSDQTDSPYNATAALVKTQGKACLVVANNVETSQIVGVLKQLDLFAGTPTYSTANVGFSVMLTEDGGNKLYLFDLGGGPSKEVVWGVLQGMKEKLKDHTVPTRKENPIKKWMVSKGESSITLEDGADMKDPHREYLEGEVSINELCVDTKDGTLTLATDPDLGPASVTGIAIFGYTGE